MIVEIVLQALEAELFSSGNVLGEVVEIGRVGWIELVGVDGFLIEVGVRFDRADFL